MNKYQLVGWLAAMVTMVSASAAYGWIVPVTVAVSLIFFALMPRLRNR